jgi:hypothetical protein
MNIDDVINDFAGAESDLPEASMQWALDNWDIALPRFQELSGAIRRRRRSERSRD